MLAGLALTYRPDLVIAVGLMAGWMLWRHRDARRPFVLAGVVGLTPLWVHLVMAGPAQAFEGMVLDPVFRLRDGRELPRPPSWEHLDGGLQAVAEEIPPWWKVPHLSASHTLFLWFFLMLVVAAGLLGFAVWLRRRDGGRTGRSVALLAVALVSVGILPQALQRPDSAHLMWVTCVSLPFSAVAVTEALRRWRPRIDGRSAVAIGGAVAIAVTFVFTGMFTFRYYLLHTRVGLGQVPGAFAVQRGDRNFYLGDHRAYLGVQAAVDELARRAEPGDRLLVGPSDLRRTWYSDVFIYWLFPELEPATYYIEMDPGLANAEGSSLADDVASADWVILTGLWDGWMEPNSSMEFGSDAPEPGPPRPLLRRRRLRGRPGGAVPALPLTQRHPPPHPAGQVTEDAEHRTERGRHPDGAPAATERLDGGVGDGGGRRGERRRLHPLGHLRVDEAGPHDEHAGARSGEGVAEPLGEAVEPGLRRAVDEVGLADALAGDARQHDEPAVALAAELGGDREAAADRTGVVDRDHRRRGGRIGVQLGLVDELPERHDDDVEVAVAGDEVGDERLVACRCRRRRSAPCRP